MACLAFDVRVERWMRHADGEVFEVGFKNKGLISKMTKKTQDPCTYREESGFEL